MGQNNSRQSETINWNQIKTNDMSSTIPNLNGISREAQELISRLNLPEVSESNSEFNTNNILNINNSLNLNKNNKELISDENDVSSPFISSEMYNYIVNKYNNKSSNGNMVGGGAEDMEDDSSTSATSSSLSSNALKSSSSETNEKPKKKEHKKKEIEHKKKEHKKKEIDESDEEVSEESEVVSEEKSEEEEKYSGWKRQKAKATKGKSKPKANYTGSEYLSYVSSSAHTGGSLTESVANENNYTISTVRTSDINMISE
jgi:hypothetical protein